MSFQNLLEKELTSDSYNESQTENGATGYRTTGKHLLDMNFKTSSYRSREDSELITDFLEAWNENPEYAIKWLFFARDARGGMGEKRLFKTIFKYLLDNGKGVEHLVKHIPFYGSFKDWRFFANKNNEGIFTLIKEQLEADVKGMQEGKGISLLAKWMPKISTKTSRRQAIYFAEKLNVTHKEYRKTLSTLNKYLNTVETKISANKWNEVNYERVPSKANIKYADAWLRHDGERRTEFLKDNEKKINASVVFPHEIAQKIYLNSDNSTMEKMWKNLPDCELTNTMVVADGSGSMNCYIGGGKTTALTVCHALAIYFAERNQGVYKNSFITFSEHPKFVRFTDNNSLYEKLRIANKHSEVANTNIEKVFDLILDTAVKNQCAQNEIPHQILILSDMEFDQATRASYANGNKEFSNKLFNIIEKRFEDAGYILPKIIFWNLNSRTDTIPMKEGKFGTTLVSGFSPQILSMLMSKKTDPYEVLLEKLLSERYSQITLKV